MLFLKFSSQEERRRRYGSCLIELQYCRLPEGTDIETIVSVESILHWQDDSLYVSDTDRFFRMYGSVFEDGIRNNLTRGVMDLYGINYYGPSEIRAIRELLRREKPEEYEILLDWLGSPEAGSGIYILGI